MAAEAGWLCVASRPGVDGILRHTPSSHKFPLSAVAAWTSCWPAFAATFLHPPDPIANNNNRVCFDLSDLLKTSELPFPSFVPARYAQTQTATRSRKKWVRKVKPQVVQNQGNRKCTFDSVPVFGPLQTARNMQMRKYTQAFASCECHWFWPHNDCD